ncbi:sel1 repeat family protein [Cystobacter fuscus]|uniref:tetratricopeptide repeat protein n=1 Tax=Cystobacter fuscus TaxID=43 RepID=UPI002B2E1F53|nr:sel1 repeat family protein [Cystobacter fuscus]
MNPRVPVESQAPCSLSVALLTLGLTLVGCATAPPRTPLVPEAASPAVSSPEVCTDAANCREALRNSPRDTLSECEVQRRVELARRACALDVAEGCTELGRWETRGLVKEGGPDLHVASDLFQRACALGDGEGCALRALMTLRGQGVARDAGAARAGLQDACDRFPGSACGLAVQGLAEEALRGGTEPEWEWMALFAQRGCDAGDGLSCRILGEAFYSGRGIAQDTDKAAGLYARACEAGDGEACARQGMLLRAEGPWAEPRAEQLLSRGCELGSPEACRLTVLETLDSQGSSKNAADRRALFRHACDRGAALGCLALYDELRDEPLAPRPVFELPGLLKRACLLGAGQACEFLDEVSQAARPRCASGSASACGVLGVLLLSPPLRQGESTEGERLLHAACEGGDLASCKGLSERSGASEDLTCRSR